MTKHPPKNFPKQSQADELSQLRLEKEYYKTQLEKYLKIHQEDQEELKNMRSTLVKSMIEELTHPKLLQKVSSRLIEEENVDILYRHIVEAAKDVMQSDNEFWVNGQKEAFQAAMSGLPLTVSLKALIDTIITHTNGAARAAFYILPLGSKALFHVVGMPDGYANEIKDFKVGPESLACGLAMHTGEPVITSDVEQEPRWKPWIHLPRKYNFRACWSFPIHTEGGSVVGTMAIYFSQPRQPLPRELELAGVLTHAAAIIISREWELMERAQAEEALREKEKQLKTLVRLRDEFIGNASHELNTPLTSMMIYAEILERHFNESADSSYRKMIEKLSFQVKRLHTLIRNMLDTTRLAEGKLLLVISRFDLNKLISEKSEDMQQDTKKHKIITQLNPISELEADEERIGQVIINLVSNAIKYSPLGGKILLTSSMEKDFIKVSVKDYGIGIQADALEIIFERFYRVNSKEAQTFPGMGIGLSICRDIIDMHQGKITVESKEGIGSTFSFIIPIKQTKENK